MAKVGRPDIDSFQTAIRRLDKDGEIEIVPITVSSLLRAEQYKH